MVSLKSSLRFMRNSPEDEEFNKINIVIPKYKNRQFFRRVDNTPSS